MKKTLILDVISTLLIILFVYTAVSKLINYNGFVWKLGTSPIVSVSPVLFSILIPAAELITSGLLLTQRYKKWGLYSAFALMSLFTLYVAYMLLFASRLPCTCGGIIKMMTWKQHLVFNTIFTILAFIAIKLFRQEQESNTVIKTSEKTIYA